MQKKAVFLIILLIGLISCCCSPKNIKHSSYKQAPILSEPLKRKIWIDSSFSNRQKELIIDAFKTLECSTNYSIVKYSFVINAGLNNIGDMMNEPSIMVVNASINDPRIRVSDKNFKDNKKEKYTIGMFSTKNEHSPTIFLVSGRLINDKDFYKVVLHEAIHSLNIAEHSDSKHAIMYWAEDENDAKELTIIDLYFICEYYKCDASQMNICKGN